MPLLQAYITIYDSTRKHYNNHTLEIKLLYRLCYCLLIKYLWHGSKDKSSLTLCVLFAYSLMFVSYNIMF